MPRIFTHSTGNRTGNIWDRFVLQSFQRNLNFDRVGLTKREQKLIALHRLMKEFNELNGSAVASSTGRDEVHPAYVRNGERRRYQRKMTNRLLRDLVRSQLNVVRIVC